MNNIEDAKKLYWKYMCITYEDLVVAEKEIQKQYNFHKEVVPNLILHKITGFGSQYTCMMCKVNCPSCCYEIATGQSCSSGVNHNTYWAIHEAKDLQQLLSAIKDRAHWLAEIIVAVENRIKYDTNTD